MEAEIATAAWGTWEELLLGGAVLRYGTEKWEVVANAIQERTRFPFNFTPEACKAKYEELRKQYSDHKAMFEELRKQRMAELKRSLEQSDELIGSLQLKIRNLEAGKVDEGNVDYDSGQMESPTPIQKSDCLESSGKETSKDGLSAGSFTHETPKNWSAQCRTPSTVSPTETNSQQEKVATAKNRSLPETFLGEQERSFKKARGKRKRKVCTNNIDVKEGSVGESEFLGHVENSLTVSRSKETSTDDDFRVEHSGLSNFSPCATREDGPEDLMSIFDSVVNNENASPFWCRHDSQKRAPYKNLIKQHMDFDTIRSRIAKHIVKSKRELFRDLLLLANNAVLFYSKTTREHKSAVLLRDYITKLLRVHEEQELNRQKATVAPVGHHGPAVCFLSLLSNAPVKPRSIRPYNKNVWRKTVSGKKFVTWSSQERKHSTELDSLHSTGDAFVHQEHERPFKQHFQEDESPSKQRKRARKKMNPTQVWC